MTHRKQQKLKELVIILLQHIAEMSTGYM